MNACTSKCRLISYFPLKRKEGLMSSRRRAFRLAGQSGMAPLHGEQLLLHINAAMWGEK